MAIIKNEFPILEYDTAINGIIKPNLHKKINFPENCVMTFFKEVIEEYKNNKTEIISEYKSEMGIFPLYKTQYNNMDLCIIQAVVGSASIAMMTEYLIGGGVKKLITCGGCGVLNEIPVGDVILPTVALRDEGASYHYLPPSREISLNEIPIKAIKRILHKYEISYIECKTWTTDGFFRETPDMVKYRKEEGCSVVEMECATIASIAEFKNIMFGQLLYSGDILANLENYDERNWFNKLPSRKKLFTLSIESLYELNKMLCKEK
jgi:uridine phosphorylase